jgi:hypothetical protein
VALFPSSPIWSRQAPVPSLLHFGILITACGRWHHSWQLSTLPLSFVVSGPITSRSQFSASRRPRRPTGPPSGGGVWRSRGRNRPPHMAGEEPAAKPAKKPGGKLFETSAGLSCHRDQLDWVPTVSAPGAAKQAKAPGCTQGTISRRTGL